MSKSPPFTIHSVDPAREFISVTYHTSTTEHGDRANNIFGLIVRDWYDEAAVLQALDEYGQNHYGKHHSKRGDLASIVGKRHGDG